MKPKKKESWLPCEPYDVKIVTDPEKLKLIENDPFFKRKREEAQRNILTNTGYLKSCWKRKSNWRLNLMNRFFLTIKERTIFFVYPLQTRPQRQTKRDLHMPQ